MVDGLLIVLPAGLPGYVAQLRAEDYPFVLIDHGHQEVLVKWYGRQVAVLTPVDSLDDINIIQVREYWPLPGTRADELPEPTLHL